MGAGEYRIRGPPAEPDDDMLACPAAVAAGAAAVREYIHEFIDHAAALAETNPIDRAEFLELGSSCSNSTSMMQKEFNVSQSGPHQQGPEECLCGRAGCASDHRGCRRRIGYTIKTKLKPLILHLGPEFMSGGMVPSMVDHSAEQGSWLAVCLVGSRREDTRCGGALKLWSNLARK